MGRQVGFYMTQADEQCFVEAIRAKDDVVIASVHFPTSDPEVVGVLPPAGPRPDRSTNLAIYNLAIRPKLIVYRVESRSEFALDLTRSEVLQFNRSFIRADGKLEPGRLWYDHETMGGKPKRKSFIDWAQSVFRVVKSNSHHSEAHQRYFGPGAWMSFEEGTLILAPY
jgi:hypothetical protein